MITDIRLQHFRSYDDASYELGGGVNIIVGPNASGKTNLLEAVLVSALGNSYRAKDAELVAFGAQWTRIDTDTPTGSRVIKLIKQNEMVKKTFEIDGQPFQRLSLQKTIPTVLFEPNHLLLIAGAPELRRNFLDDLIEQTLLSYAATRRHYRRVVSQRNALLKKGFQTASSQIFVWNLRLSELAGKIASERLALVGKINALATDIYQDLSNTKTKIKLEYRTNCAIDQYETSLLKKLEANLERDCAIGYTTAGPHRDDLAILLNNHPAEETASRGEARTLVLMLKIVELQTLEVARGTAPLLLLDDVFSELDGARRHALTTHIQPYQTFITTTDADVVVKHFVGLCNIIPLGRN